MQNETSLSYMSLSGNDRKFRVELMKEKNNLLVYFFPQRSLDWVEIEYVYTWIYMHTELDKKKCTIVSMLLFYGYFFSFICLCNKEESLSSMGKICTT